MLTRNPGLAKIGPLMPALLLLAGCSHSQPPVVADIVTVAERRRAGQRSRDHPATPRQEFP